MECDAEAEKTPYFAKAKKVMRKTVLCMWCILKRERNLELVSVVCGFVLFPSSCFIWLCNGGVLLHILKQPYQLPRKI